MSIDGIVEWFDALPLVTQICFGVFAVFMALPIATLTLMQFFESLRVLRELSRAKKLRKNEDEDR